MNIRRKAAYCLFTIVLMFSLFGCDTDNESDTNPIIVNAIVDNNNQTNQIDSSVDPLLTTRDIVIGFSQLGTESDWRNANTLSIKEAALEAGIELQYENAEQSQEQQFEAIRSFIQKEVDVIAIAPVIQSGWEPILQEVKLAGIPVIITDRAVEVSDPSLYVTFIGSDFYDEGRKAGKFLLDKMRDATDMVGVVELRGTEGSTPSIERGNGFHDTIKSYSQYVMLQSESANFTLEQGKKVMESFLDTNGDNIDVLFAHNDDMALGAIEAIEEYGLQPGIDIVIISVDGTRKAFEMMVEGKINCVVECNPLLGPYLMQAVKELIAGRDLPKRITPPESVFTQEMAKKEVGNRKY